MYELQRLLVKCFLTLLLIASICHCVLAQGGSTTGNITGNVTDEVGAVISGATIVAKNLATGITREVTSAEDGSFLVVQLPPGSYEVVVTAEGFKSQSFQFDLILGTNSLLTPKLAVGASSEIIEVVASVTTEETKTESSTNIDRQRIDTLPINRRNFLDFTLTTPRAVKDRVPAQGASASSGLSFNGQPARFNNITIDGLENNDTGSGSVRSTYSQEAVQEFQVVSDSYSAEFGRALGGVVNIVTKGGTSEFHGTLFFLTRNDKTSARDVFAPFEPEYKQYQFGATISGPIKKDRAFFFTSFERLSVKQSNFVTIGDKTASAARQQGFDLVNGPVPFALNNTSFLARMDLKATPNDTLYVRYNYGGTYNGQLEPFGGLLGESNGGIQKLTDNSVAVNNTYLNVGLNLINETRFLFGKRDQNIVPLGEGPQVRVVAPEGLVTFGRGTLLPQPRKEDIVQIVNNVTLDRGRHQIKFGVDFAYVKLPGGTTDLPIFTSGLALFLPINFSQLAGIPGLPSFTGLEAFDPNSRSAAQKQFLVLLSAVLPQMAPGFPAGLPLTDLPLPFAFAQGFGDPSVELSSKQFSVFVKDDFKLRPNLLIKAGLRYDINRATLIANNNGNLSPRIAFSYQPGAIKNLRIHGSYGLFFGAPLFGLSSVVQLTSATDKFKVPVIPFPFAILPYQLPGHRFPTSSTIPPGVTFTPQLSTIFTNDPKQRNSYTQQINAGVEYLINSSTVLSLTYDYVRGIKLLSQRDINPVVRPIPGDPLNSQLIGRRDPTRGQVFEFESAFDSYYNAFTVSLNRRFSNKISVLAHYTFSKAIDNFIDIRFDLQEAIDPLRPRDERGLSLQDLRNRFVLSGNWDLDYTKNPFLRGFSLSTILNLESGRPYNLLAGIDLNMNADNPPGDRPIVNGASIGRNAGIAPGFANLDLRLNRNISINEKFRVQAFVEVFNLFNRVNISELDRIFLPNAQGVFTLPSKEGGRFTAPRERARGAFSPRQFQFGFRMSF